MDLKYSKKINEREEITEISNSLLSKKNDEENEEGNETNFKFDSLMDVTLDVNEEEYITNLKFAILMNNNQKLNLDEFKIDINSENLHRKDNDIDFVFVKFNEEMNLKVTEINSKLTADYFEDLYEIIYEEIIRIFYFRRKQMFND